MTKNKGDILRDQYMVDFEGKESKEKKLIMERCCSNMWKDEVESFTVENDSLEGTICKMDMYWGENK